MSFKSHTSIPHVIQPVYWPHCMHINYLVPINCINTISWHCHSLQTKPAAITPTNATNSPKESSSHIHSHKRSATKVYHKICHEQSSISSLQEIIYNNSLSYIVYNRQSIIYIIDIIYSKQATTNSLQQQLYNRYHKQPETNAL